jgi:hypothetical protein
MSTVVVLGKISLGQNPKKNILNMYSGTTRRPESQFDYEFENPVKNEDSGVSANTSVLVSKKPLGRFESFTIKYNRLHISTLGVISVQKGTSTSVFQLLEKINTKYNTSFTQDDVVDNVLGEADGNGDVIVELVLTGKSLQFYSGSVVNVGIGISTTLPGSANINNLTVTINAFTVSGFTFNGGNILALPNGTWYIGVELSSKQLRTLPRLGHRGWIPVAKIETNATEVTSILSIPPVMPSCRIPRTMDKVLAGKPISVVVMGSSLTQSGGGATDWPGMLFGAGTPDKYKIPVTVTAQYTGVGGSPNMYQLAMCGFGSSDSNYGYPGSGYPGGLLAKMPPNGRSTLFTGVDLVVLGCLANGGDYRLDCIEPIIRKLKSFGVEVIVITDNPQGPSTNYNTMSNAGLYTDGPTLVKITDLYGVELADTAAYVFESYIRAKGVGIYSDTIHQANGTPFGPEALLPANGHEAYARAIRGLFSIQTITTVGSTTTLPIKDFNDGTVQTFINYSAASVTNVNNELVVTKNTASITQWGANLHLGLGTLQTGDIVNVRGTVRNSGYGSPSLGVASGSWASNTTVINGNFNLNFTVNRLAATATILFFGNLDTAAINSNFTLDDIQATVTTGNSYTNLNIAPNRRQEIVPLPPIRVVTDFKTPADAFIILPKDELFITSNNANKGTLSAHPWGSGSFSRKFSSAIGSTTDLLTLATGKRAIMSGTAVVGMSIIHYRDVADAGCTFNILINGNLSKSVTINTVPFANEWYLSLYTPTELNASLPSGAANNSIEIVVTSGTLKIAAFVCLTADITFVLPEEINYIGTWLGKELSRSSLPGRPTDTAGSYAMLRARGGRRVAWVVSANPGSRMVDVLSDREQTASVAVTGNYHVRTIGALLGPEANHVIKCVETNATGDQANGHSLHVGGAFIINDR